MYPRHSLHDTVVYTMYSQLSMIKIKTFIFKLLLTLFFITNIFYELKFYKHKLSTVIHHAGHHFYNTIHMHDILPSPASNWIMLDMPAPSSSTMLDMPALPFSTTLEAPVDSVSCNFCDSGYLVRKDVSPFCIPGLMSVRKDKLYDETILSQF